MILGSVIFLIAYDATLPPCAFTGWGCGGAPDVFTMLGQALLALGAIVGIFFAGIAIAAIAKSYWAGLTKAERAVAWDRIQTIGYLFLAASIVIQVIRMIAADLSTVKAENIATTAIVDGGGVVTDTRVFLVVFVALGILAGGMILVDRIAYWREKRRGS